MKDRKEGQSATGQNAGPDDRKQPRPEATDMPMGSTSERRKDQRKMGEQGVPERGSFGNDETSP